MDYIKIKDGETVYPYTMTDLKKELREGEFSENGEVILLGRNATEEEIAEYGVFPVTLTDKPDGDVVTMYAAIQDGGWVQKWESRSFTNEEKATRRESMVATQEEARLALIDAGIFESDIQAVIATMPSPDKEKAQARWGYASVIRRLDPLVIAIGPALGLDEDKLDELFK